MIIQGNYFSVLEKVYTLLDLSQISSRNLHHTHRNTGYMPHVIYVVQNKNNARSPRHIIKILRDKSATFLRHFNHIKQ